MSDDNNIEEPRRLGDRILSALKMALDQKDVKIANLLTQALELSMTRSAGGEEFVERRDYPEEVESCMEILHEMRKQHDSTSGGSDPLL